MKNILCFSLFLLCFSCKKENSNEPTVDISKIYGKWDWIGSSGGLTGKSYTPQSEHQNQRLIIANDNKMSFYINDTLKIQRQFTLRKDKSFLTGDSAYIIHYMPASLDQVILKAKTDTLILSDEANDGFTSGYVKHK